MNTLKTSFILIAKSLLVIFFLVIVVVAIAPELINLEMVREKIKNTVSGEIGGDIKFRRLEMSYFPRPHVVIHKVGILIPDSFTINIHRMKVYPKFLSLFTGRFQIGVVTLEYADYFMQLPQLNENIPRSEQISSFDNILKAITKAILGLPEFKLPELNLKIRHGKINLVDPFGHKFKLREVQAVYQRSPSKLDFSIRCKSNLWDQIDFNGSLNPLDFRGKGRLELSRFRPQTLIAYLLHDSELQVTDTKANLTIDIAMDGTGGLQAEFKGAFPFLALSRGNEKMTIKGGRVLGKFHFSDNAAEISLKEVGLDYPELNATGKFSYNKLQQDIHLTLEGSRIDAASVRQVALSLMGESETIQQLFEIIKGGQVPKMKVDMRGHKIADLGMLENLVIKGRMTQGKIFIPGAELNLEDVDGDALISGGVLYGTNLNARMAKSLGQNGKMSLGLNNNLAPFHLKIGVNADLSQLPPVLSRVVEDRDFLKELALIKDVTGTATGTLTLGDDLASLNAKVTASNIHLTARYKRVPHAVGINGGHFSYGGTGLTLRDFNANIGKSSFVGPSIEFDWSGTPDFKLISPSADFDLAELYNWLLSSDSISKHMENISELKGKVSVTGLKINGPLFSPQDWHFQTRGSADNLVLTSKILPTPLQIGHGQFTWQGHEIVFKKVNAILGKSSILHTAGNVIWAKTPVFEARSESASLNLEDIVPIIQLNKRFSAALDRFRPLDGTLALNSMTVKGPLSIASFEQMSFSADVNQVTLSSKRLPATLRVSQGLFSWGNNRLAMKDVNASLGKSMVSRLSVLFNRAKTSFFEVSSRSVKLFTEEIYPWLVSFEEIQPWLQDFSIINGNIALSDLILKGPYDYPEQWDYGMKCKFEDLILVSAAFGEPVVVSNGSISLTREITPEVARSIVKLESADLTWGNNPLMLSGEMIFIKDDTWLDLMVNADVIDWYQIKNIVDYVENQKEDPGSRISKRDLLGFIKIQISKFNYQRYSVQPLKAEISFVPEKVIIAVNEAVWCSISFQGRLQAYDQTWEISLTPVADNQSLASAVSCIANQEDLAMGEFDLSGELLSKNKPDEFLQSLAGNTTFSAEKGRIYRLGLLAKLLSILNVTEIYRGELPDLRGEGFAYHGIKISADLKDGKLIMNECYIDGVSMGIACEGDIDLADKNMDLVILVAPFKTVDRIVKALPLVKHILGGRLISIPFSAKGDLDDPIVIPLHPTAVGSGVLGILERTLKLPITIMQPVFSLGKNKANDQPGEEKQGPTGFP